MSQYETTHTTQTAHRPWIRLSGIGLALAGALLAALGAIVFTNPEPAAYEILDPVAAAVFLALALGLPATYAYDRHWFDRFATIGFGLLVVGSIATAVGFTLVVSIFPSAFLAFLIGFPVMLIGAVVYGIAMHRARTAPRTGSMLLIAALPIGLLAAAAIVATGAMVPPWAGAMVVYGLAWFVLGNRLL